MFETGVDAMIHMQKAVRCKYMREGEYYGSIHSFPHPLVTSSPSNFSQITTMFASHSIASSVTLTGKSITFDKPMEDKSIDHKSIDDSLVPLAVLQDRSSPFRSKTHGQDSIIEIPRIPSKASITSSGGYEKTTRRPTNTVSRLSNSSCAEFSLLKPPALAKAIRFMLDQTIEQQNLS
jgi:hypothetical protein